MPRFDDGMVDLRELIQLIAEQVVNGIMDTETNQLCPPTGNSRNGYKGKRLVTRYVPTGR